MTTIQDKLTSLLTQAYAMHDKSSHEDHAEIGVLLYEIIERDRKLVEALREIMDNYSGDPMNLFYAARNALIAAGEDVSDE